MEETDTHEAERGPKVTYDVPCPGCGYNLRGLQGDPVCCPECAVATPQATLVEIAAEIARRTPPLEQRLRRQIGALCSLIGLGLVPLSVWLYFEIRTGCFVRRVFHPMGWTAAGVVAVGIMLLVLRCWGTSGWLRAAMCCVLLSTIGWAANTAVATLLGAIGIATGQSATFFFLLVALVVLVLNPGYWLTRLGLPAFDGVVATLAQRRRRRDASTR